MMLVVSQMLTQIKFGLGFLLQNVLTLVASFLETNIHNPKPADL